MMRVTLGQMETLGAGVAVQLRAGDVVGLSGDLGAGKTTLARGVLRALGLESEAPSPSFAIIQPYAPPETRLNVLHVDLYRIKNPAELGELGLDEARRDHALLIEWPEHMGAHRWDDMLNIRLEWAGDDARRLTVHAPPSWESRCRFLK
ncbi:MAG: tRNA (adenosine(37)-N6)-threonylcarbamoyltransferase complex ATPase subunit type 1 TsaE [Sphingopyxis sp.]